MHRFSSWILFLCLAVMPGTQPVSAEPSGKDGLDRPRFSFALIGDLQYSAREEAEFPFLREEINGENLAFVVHDGDFKSGASLCSDEVYYQRREDFNAFAHPFIFLFGDNEWTDCHRPAAGGYDPLERLALLRSLFTGGDVSLGRRTIRLDRQSGDPRYAKFRENVRWMYGNVLFVGLHIVGSNNNLGRTPSADAEYGERNAANLAWLRDSFAQARSTGARGVMLVMQANPNFELPGGHPGRSGFEDFLAALEQEALSFSGPMVLVHGDTHYYRIDKPMYAASDGRRIMNITRVETFGSPDVHWVKATVDFRDPNLFSFEQRIVTDGAAGR